MTRPETARPEGQEATITFASLREANVARQAAWCADGDPVPDLSFRGIELAGETGEALNVIKKLERAATAGTEREGAGDGAG